MAEAAYLFGWKPNEILKMEAAIFFKTLNHGRKIYSRERALLVYDMCDAMTIPLHIDNYKVMKQNYMDRAFPRKKKNRALPADNIDTARIVASAMHAVAPFMRQTHV